MSSSIGQAIQRELQRQGLSQKELAARANVTEAAISRYINGDREPRAVTLLAIAKALGVSTADLTGEEAPSPSNMDEAVELLERNAGAISPEQRQRLINALSKL